MKTHTFYRKADVSKTVAIDGLMKRFPDADIVRFIEKNATPSEAKAAGVKPGSKIFEAKIRLAEFPPTKEEESGDSNNGGNRLRNRKPLRPKPKPRPKNNDVIREGEEGEEDAAPKFDFPGEGNGENGLDDKPEEMDNDEKIVHLLEQILDAIKSGGLGEGPEEDDLGPDAGLELPDIGAPTKGDSAPLPGGGPGGRPGGGPGGGSGGAPLPPPAKPRNVGAPAAFSKFNPNLQSVTLVREGVTDKITTTSIKEEAEELFPTHKVARIKRRGDAVINGSQVNLPDANIAVVTLVKK